jgi:hypothetical protein
MVLKPLVNLTGGNLNDQVITGPGYVPIVPTKQVPADVVASASQNRNTTPLPTTPNISQPSPPSGGSGSGSSGGGGGSGNSSSTSSNVSTPEVTGPSYETVKGGIESNISSLTQNEIKVLLSPESAKFTDASGKEYSKQQALFQIEQGKKSLQGNLATIQSYQSQGYHIRQGPEGSFEFFKTPEEIRQENLSASESKLRSSMTGDAGQRVAGLGAWVTSGFLSWEDPFGLKSTAQVLMGDTEGAIKTKASAMYDLDTAISEGPAAYTLKVATGPFATVGSTFVMSAGIGAGVGAIKAAFPTIGKIVEGGVAVGFGAIVVKDTIPVAENAIKTGDYSNLASHAGMLAVTAYVGFKGYTIGNTFGSGRVDAFLYGRHTYEPGSPELIRYKSALKISRNLENVVSDKMDPLDIKNDILRMDTATAERTIDYLESNPKTVIGGSASSYTQIVDARQPRDIDLLTRKGPAATQKAIDEIGAETHVVDIHGKELYEPGRHARFGFSDKDPLKIGDYKYMRAGEQLTRKGISSVLEETKYRHGTFPGFPTEETMNAPKDIFDFVVHTKSLSRSAEKSINPLTNMRGKIASEELEIFLNPEKSPSFGKGKNSTNNFLRGFTKKPKVEIIEEGLNNEDVYVLVKGRSSSKVSGVPEGMYLPGKSESVNLNVFNNRYPSKNNSDILIETDYLESDDLYPKNETELIKIPIFGEEPYPPASVSLSNNVNYNGNQKFDLITVPGYKGFDIDTPDVPSYQENYDSGTPNYFPGYTGDGYSIKNINKKSLQKNISLTGFDEESGSLIALFGRHKEYRLGSLKKALDLGMEFKL